MIFSLILKKAIKMKTTHILLSAFLFLMLCSFGLKPISSYSSETKYWMSFEEMQEAQKKEKRKVIVDVYTDWCGWCKKMDKTTFEHPAIQKYMNEKYYFVKFNAESKQSVKYKGKTYDNLGRYHELSTELMNGKMAFPTSIYLNENLEQITPPIASYLDAKQFEVIIHYLAEEKYKSISFEDYQKTFKSAIAE